MSGPESGNDLRARYSAVIFRYLDRWWRPPAVFASCLACCCAAGLTVDSLECAAFAVPCALTAISLGGIVVAATGNLLRRRWRTAAANLLTLPLCYAATAMSILTVVLERSRFD